MARRAASRRGPTPWDRTRTSRASAERADQLRQSGRRRRASGRSRARRVRFSMGACQGTLIVIALRLSESRLGRARRRTSGVGAIADPAIAPLAYSRSGLMIQITSHEIRLCLHPASGRGAAGSCPVRPRTSEAGPGAADRNEEGPPGFPGGPSRVWSDLVESLHPRGGPPGGDATAGAIVIAPKLLGFRREHHRLGTGIRPAPRQRGGALPGLTVM